MSGSNYKTLEVLFERGLSHLEQVLNASEKQEVQEFLNVGEYGVALETLRYLLIEENKTISQEAFNLIEALADEMGIGDKVLCSELKQCVR